VIHERSTPSEVRPAREGSAWERPPRMTRAGARARTCPS